MNNKELLTLRNRLPLHATPCEKREAPKQSLLNATALLYLEAAIEKNAGPLHPNFEKALDEKRKLAYTLIRASYAATKGIESPKTRAIRTAKFLLDDGLAYVLFWKDLVSSCAYNAHMECNRLDRTFDKNAIDEALDAMDDDHPITDDVPVFDRARIDPELREPYAGPTDDSTIAESVDDAHEAISGIKEWCSLAVRDFTPNALEYWGLTNGIPFGQYTTMDEDGEKTYHPIHNFDAYRTYTTEAWKKKQKPQLKPDTIDQMEEA